MEQEAAIVNSIVKASRRVAQQVGEWLNTSLAVTRNKILMSTAGLPVPGIPSILILNASNIF